MIMAKTMQEDSHVVNQIKAGTYIEGIVKAAGDVRVDEIERHPKLVLAYQEKLQETLPVKVLKYMGLLMVK